jgi:hypothetical protein
MGAWLRFARRESAYVWDLIIAVLVTAIAIVLVFNPAMPRPLVAAAVIVLVPWMGHLALSAIRDLYYLATLSARDYLATIPAHEHAPDGQG